jgi:hypothetical protein
MTQGTFMGDARVHGGLRPLKIDAVETFFITTGGKNHVTVFAMIHTIHIR